MSRGREGRHDSIARMGIGVMDKQLLVHLWTFLQNVSSLSRIFIRGVNKSDPYNRIAAMREEAR